MSNNETEQGFYSELELAQEIDGLVGKPGQKICILTDDAQTARTVIGHIKSPCSNKSEFHLTFPSGSSVTFASRPTHVYGANYTHLLDYYGCSQRLWNAAVPGVSEE